MVVADRAVASGASRVTLGRGAHRGLPAVAAPHPSQVSLLWGRMGRDHNKDIVKGCPHALPVLCGSDTQCDLQFPVTVMTVEHA